MKLILNNPTGCYLFCRRVESSSCFERFSIDIDDYMLFGSANRITDAAWEFQKKFYDNKFQFKNDLLIGLHHNIYDLIQKHNWYVDYDPEGDRTHIVVEVENPDDMMMLKLIL